LKVPVTTFAAPAAAEATPLPDVVVDPVPVELVVVGTVIVGIVTDGVVVFGMVTLGTEIDGADICETFGKNGIEL
jgi:hypothetical protein